MKFATLDVTVGQLVAERPERARLFEAYGIDYCCGGSRPLGEACAVRHIDAKEVLRRLVKLDALPQNGTDTDWTLTPISQLVDHITGRHHAYLHETLPRISYLINRVWDAHAAHHPELSDVAAVFSALRNEMEAHMAKEEQIVFPLCRSLEETHKGSAAPTPRLKELTEIIVGEHRQTADAFQQLRRLTNDFVPPVDACPTYRVMLNSLAELEDDTHQHVHKENNILFPRAIALAERKATKK